ncbi:hypothetical protein BH20ACT16_BH20ACT16_13060 [soil metagenome]
MERPPAGPSESTVAAAIGTSSPQGVTARDESRVAAAIAGH